ncbi:hypothetical protein Pla52o_24880 [Novipirellula galeiformis]|uniref:Uncharacterized protein n=1 Tax=Novipirellula galeiformis TaxID=2528004 RepID=A0A5C6CFX2_9BACT|nr:hypothetical protein Pla52o_24880 [Novipirellula galeiformis]
MATISIVTFTKRPDVQVVVSPTASLMPRALFKFEFRIAGGGVQGTRCWVCSGRRRLAFAYRPSAVGHWHRVPTSLFHFVAFRRLRCADL